MRVLVTGGCGFVGSNLAAEALARGHELAILDNLYRTGSEQNLVWLKGKGKFRFYRADIRNANDVMVAVEREKPDVVFHLAGQVAMTTSIENPRLDFETNALGTFNLLEAIRRASSNTAVLYSSTNKVYGDLEQYHYQESETRYSCQEYPNGFSEAVPLDFHSPYGCSKGSADQYLRDYHRMFGIKTVVFRHSSMYGGRQYATYDQGWIGWFCQKALEIAAGKAEKPFTISGDGKQVRDVLYATDIIRLYFSAHERIDAIAGEAFNIGGSMANSLSLLELFGLLEHELGIDMRYKRLPWRESDQKVFVADIEKARRLIGWEPLATVEKGIRETLSWLKLQ